MNRINTGVLRIDDDWPGVFIRGDAAKHYLEVIRQAQAGCAALVMDDLNALEELLESCHQKSGAPVQHIERKEQ